MLLTFDLTQSSTGLESEKFDHIPIVIDNSFIVEHSQTSADPASTVQHHSSYLLEQSLTVPDHPLTVPDHSITVTDHPLNANDPFPTPTVQLPETYNIHQQGK